MPLARQKFKVAASFGTIAAACAERSFAPSATKSFCMSTTIIAVLLGSTCSIRYGISLSPLLGLSQLSRRLVAVGDVALNHMKHAANRFFLYQIRIHRANPACLAGSMPMLKCSCESHGEERIVSLRPFKSVLPHDGTTGTLE